VQGNKVERGAAIQAQLTVGPRLFRQPSGAIPAQMGLSYISLRKLLSREEKINNSIETKLACTSVIRK